MAVSRRGDTDVCSLLLAWNAIEDAPILLAANRDESYDRPATGPRMLNADPCAIAPLDEAGGGTWLGVNDHELVVAIANRDDGPEGERSRGQLVRDLLSVDTADEARTYLASLLGEHRYAGFHLLLLDPERAFYVTWDGELDGQSLTPGVHLLDNDGLDEGSTIPRTVRGSLEPGVGEEPQAWLDRATDILADHDAGLCHHGEDYGTVSSSTVTVANGLEHHIEFAYCDGPPCEGTFASTTLESHL